MERNLQYKYDDYEEDFHQEDHNDKNTKLLTSDYQLQTTLNQPPKDKTIQQEQYKDDFIEGNEETISPKPTPNKKIFDNTPSREKMIEQNIKLKTQIYELAKQMDEIVQR